MRTTYLLLLISYFILITAGQTDEDPLTTEDENQTTRDLSDLETTTATSEEDGVTGEEFQTQSPMFPQIKIVGGIIVQNREDFPYQVSIRYKRQNFPFCGGTIINPTHILTAAHCMVNANTRAVIPKSNIYVVAGDLKTDVTSVTTLTRDVLEIHVHEEYSTATLQHDIALLKISSLGTFDAYIDSIELAEETPEEGTRCVVSGWGTTSAGGSASIVLQSVEVPIASLDGCRSSYTNQLHDGMMCAGYVDGQKDACQGDSGGPLVCGDVLAGVVSWGYSCAQPGYPGIYTDVSQYRSWIRQHQEPELSEDDFRQSTVIQEYIVQRRADFAYQASLRYSSPNYHFCGATIVDIKHVVTAAHCVTNQMGSIISPDTLSITAGDLNIREETDTTVYRKVLEIFVHENYNSITLENDIAVLKVSDFDGWTPEIQPLALAIRTPQEGATCMTSGWGMIAPNRTYSDVLRFVNVPILNSTICQRFFEGGVTDGMICAGDSDGIKRICQIDSGGPLICDYQLVGIVSWGYNCSVIGSPTVYTKVAKHHQWVQEIIDKSSAVRASTDTILLIIFAVITSFPLLV